MRQCYKKILPLIALTGFILAAPTIHAHHSFAVHFLPEGEVKASGVVKSFRFANPHGVLEFTVINEDGEEVQWRAETNSPSILRRRGWDRDSIKAGQEVTVTGWPARNDEYYMRIRTVTFADGSVLATQAGINLSQD
jgi:hypothetical protein